MTKALLVSSFIGLAALVAVAAPDAKPATIDAQIAQGKKLYTEQCSKCHGAAGQGTKDAPAVVGKDAFPLDPRPKAKRDSELMNGPGKICMAMDIDRRLDGESLLGDTLYLTARDIEVREDDIAVSPRIGVDNSGDAAAWPLRFFLRGNRNVSAYRNV